MLSSAANAFSADGVRAVNMRKGRSRWRKFVDFITFPLRAVTLFEMDRWGLPLARDGTF